MPPVCPNRKMLGADVALPPQLLLSHGTTHTLDNSAPRQSKRAVTRK